MTHNDEMRDPFWRRPPAFYLQQSSNGYGWGVFAGKDFNRGEIVLMAPMFLRFIPSSSSPNNNSQNHGDYDDDDYDDDDCPVLQATVLNHYHYEYWAWVDGVTHERQYQLSFGYMLYFNHSSFRSNIRYCHFGKEPDLDNPSNSVGLGYYALRDIWKGEELLTDYGGPEWFSGRGIELVEKASTTRVSHDVSNDTSKPNNFNKAYDKKMLPSTIEHSSSSASRILISKLYSECDFATRRRICNCHHDALDDPPYDLRSYCLFDDDDDHCKNIDADDDNFHNHDDNEGVDQHASCHTGNNPEETTNIGYGNIICRQGICHAGETLEIAPALVLPRRRVIGTILEPLTIDWEWIVSAAIPTKVKVMICSSAEASVRTDGSKSKVAGTKSDLVEMSVRDTVLLSLAGCISMVARDPDATKYNAELEVEDDPYNSNGYLIRLVSTRSIAAGESVVVNLPKDPEHISKIVEEIVLTGQKLISST